MSKYFISLFFALVFFYFFQLITIVHAQSPIYPIKALGGCRNRNECKFFCDIPKNSPPCWSYGKYIRTSQVLGETSIGITFPIIELGNCKDAKECKLYCDNRQNQTSCINFAQLKGLDSGNNPPLSKDIIEAAKTELGCDSQTSCRNLCDNQSNRQICRDFAVKHGLLKEPKSEDWDKIQEKKMIMMESAQKDLGCDSFDSCKLACDKPENRERCTNLSQKLALSSSVSVQSVQTTPTSPPDNKPKPTGPGGCQNQQECENYCRNNSSECESLKQAAIQIIKQEEVNKQQEQSLHKGCSTEKECEEWCTNNPGKCPGFPASASPTPTITLIN